VSEPVDINGKPVQVKAAKTAYRWAESVYKVEGRESEFEIVGNEAVTRVSKANSWR